MHTSFDYVRRSFYRGNATYAALNHRNILAECNYVNEPGGTGVDRNVQYRRVVAVPGRIRLNGSGNGLDGIDGNRYRWAQAEGYRLAADLYLGPDFFCAYRNTRHSPLP